MKSTENYIMTFLKANKILNDRISMIKRKINDCQSVIDCMEKEKSKFEKMLNSHIEIKEKLYEENKTT